MVTVLGWFLGIRTSTFTANFSDRNMWPGWTARYASPVDQSHSQLTFV